MARRYQPRRFGVVFAWRVLSGRALCAACSACSPRPSGTVCCRVATGAARLSGQVPASRPVSPSCSRSSLVRSAADALPKSCPPMLACSFTTARHVTLVSSPNRAIAAFSAATAQRRARLSSWERYVARSSLPRYDTSWSAPWLHISSLTDAQNLPSGSGFRQYLRTINATSKTSARVRDST